MHFKILLPRVCWFTDPPCPSTLILPGEIHCSVCYSGVFCGIHDSSTVLRRCNNLLGLCLWSIVIKRAPILLIAFPCPSDHSKAEPRIAFGFYHLAHFKFPVGQYYMVSFIFCFGYSDLMWASKVFGVTRAYATATEFSKPLFHH